MTAFDAPTQPKVSFVIPTFRRSDALKETLDALLTVDYPSELCEVIVIDNAGDRATEAVVRRREGSAMSVRYVVDSRGGVARARNQGARLAGGDLLIFCDDDILVEPSHVRRHLATRERHGNCLVSGEWRFAPETDKALNQTPFGRYRLALDHKFHGIATGRKLDAECWEVDAFAANNLLISRALFWDLGGFDEDFPFAGIEDRELSIRARRAGCRIIRDDGIRLLHNDQTITLEQFCLREERSAQTIAVLARKHPAAERGRTFTAVNGLVTAEDAPARIVKKLVKRLLATPPLIRLMHVMVPGVEKLGLDERRMERLYSGLVGVHIFRGFRSGL